jgi:hypothetical protein
LAFLFLERTAFFGVAAGALAGSDEEFMAADGVLLTGGDPAWTLFAGAAHATVVIRKGIRKKKIWKKNTVPEWAAGFTTSIGSGDGLLRVRNVSTILARLPLVRSLSANVDTSH